MERRTDPLECHVPFRIETKMKKTKVSETAIGGVL